MAAVGEEAYLLSQLHDAVPLSTTAYLVILTKERIIEFGRQSDTAPESGAKPALTIEMLSSAMAERLGLSRGGETEN